MRKLVALLAAGMLVASMSSTAFAAKPKKVSDSFGGTLAPFPKLAAWGDQVGLTRPGCSAGQEGVNWVGQDFTAPGKGTLTIHMEGFTGDHDLYVFQDELVLARSENAQVPVGSTDIAPAEEEIVLPMTKGMAITMVACNWFGQPDVKATYEGTFK